MKVFERLSSIFGKGKPKGDLRANMQKALHMKEEAGAKAQIPPHETPREGMQPAADPHMSDATRGAEAGFTPQLKRSRVARSGDT
jgi:hypothetical protein